ncbi:hypothetical protein CH63R_02567 [Colletotrichum higginsianum IMI 349063]|uniref:Uncharacterized protein n=1 Tax=Colletotrichum higginsianum (strain IMI 349063) TaxID=759273 RepID=A0A1B7YP55_COLHI|nr:hypothetical protein CH63R_02567 [Colletotrichum higginsianum IMI 349063]OBR13841.1 hypothetical protein CH63R_02567 [Colletotrichum higginsianum IMI 349063]GJC95502.1 hypothetical protein ColKHC_04328 [Colletotrichum higginsianum]
MALALGSGAQNYKCDAARLSRDGLIPDLVCVFLDFLFLFLMTVMVAMACPGTQVESELRGAEG